MKDVVMQWIGAVVLLVFVYLVVKNGNDATRVINALSGANTNAILALQGNTPRTAL